MRRWMKHSWMASCLSIPAGIYARSAPVYLSLLGPVIALTALGAANNLYTQIGLMLLIALSA